MKLKDKDIKVFEYVKSRLEDGYPPSIREICDEFNFKSTSTAHSSINRLVDLGLLEKGDNLNRALKLVGRGSVRIPLLGTVAAGVPITAIETHTEFVSFQPNKNYSQPLFALTIKGDSMIDIGILDGDIVVVEQCNYANNGEIVVALVDNEEATVKRFFKEGRGYRLHPENESMEDMYFDHVDVLGKVVAVMRYL